MAEIGSGNSSDGGGNGENRPRVEVKTQVPQIDDRTLGKTTVSIGVEGLSIDGGGEGRSVEVGADGDRRTPVEEGHTPMGSKVRGSRLRHLDSRSAVVIIGRGLSGVGGSGSSSGGGDIRAESPPRDPAKGKGAVVAKEASRATSVELVEFRPAARSSGHGPITRGDFAEYVGEEVLARLLQENPIVVAAILVA